MQRWRLRLTNGWTAIVGLLGVGLLPCPDCGAPLAVHTWPLALLIWAFGRVRRRQRMSPNCPIQPDSAESSSSHSCAAENEAPH